LKSRFFRREIQIFIEIIFAAKNLNKIKDDYSEKFKEILEKVQSGSLYADNMALLFF
jgi:hypothetical protein